MAFAVVMWKTFAVVMWKTFAADCSSVQYGLESSAIAQVGQTLQTQNVLSLASMSNI